MEASWVCLATRPLHIYHGDDKRRVFQAFGEGVKPPGHHVRHRALVCGILVIDG